MVLYGLVVVLHILVSLFLIIVILLQGGRGGMAEAFGGGTVQSLFGSAVTTVLTRITTVVAGLFMITCLSLALLSTWRARSVIEQLPMSIPESLPSALPLEGALPNHDEGPAAVAPPASDEAASPATDGSVPSDTGDGAPPAQPAGPQANAAPPSEPPTSPSSPSSVPASP